MGVLRGTRSETVSWYPGPHGGGNCGCGVCSLERILPSWVCCSGNSHQDTTVVCHPVLNRDAPPKIQIDTCCYIAVMRLAPKLFGIFQGTCGGGRSIANSSVQFGRPMTEGNSSQSRARSAVTSRRKARLQGPQIVSSSSIHCIACAIL